MYCYWEGSARRLDQMRHRQNSRRDFPCGKRAQERSFDSKFCSESTKVVARTQKVEIFAENMAKNVKNAGFADQNTLTGIKSDWYILSLFVSIVKEYYGHNINKKISKYFFAFRPRLRSNFLQFFAVFRVFLVVISRFSPLHYRFWATKKAFRRERRFLQIKF